LRAGLPGSAYPGSGRRGRLALGQLTRDEQRVVELAESIASAHGSGYVEGRREGIKEGVAGMLAHEEVKAAVARVLEQRRKG